MRTIGAGHIFGGVTGIAANKEMIFVGMHMPRGDTSGAVQRILVLDVVTGGLLTSFGASEAGGGEGQLQGNHGIRFTPDGGHIAIAESGNNRVSIFTTSGVFVRCIVAGNMKSPRDVDFAPNGDILVADYARNRVCVFTPDGLTLVQSIREESATSPRALAVHGRNLYVLSSQGVIVFN